MVDALAVLHGAAVHGFNSGFIQLGLKVKITVGTSSRAGPVQSVVEVLGAASGLHPIPALSASLQGYVRFGLGSG